MFFNKFFLQIIKFSSMKYIFAVYLLAICYGLKELDWELNQLSSFNGSVVKYFDKADRKTIHTINDAIKKSRKLVEQWRLQSGIPGVVIGLSISGRHLWTEGFGYIDIENKVITDKNSVWRLASISKPLTSAIVGKMIEMGKLSLDKDIHEYISEDLFPKKTWNGEVVNITVRQVLSHMAGLHLTKIPDDFAHLFKAGNVSQTIESLKNEKLLFKPGTEFSYSNYGYQIIGAIIESILGDTYQNLMYNVFTELGMKSTFAETRERIVEHRPRYYYQNSDTVDDLVNTDVLDDLFSYEGYWPSGGMVSNADDLLKFGDMMLNGYNGSKTNFLNSTTVKELWTNETLGKCKNIYPNEYAKGWITTNIPKENPYPYKRLIWHSGGLLGTSTILFIFPEQNLVMTAFSNKGYTIGMDEVLLFIALYFEKFL